jgi:flavin-dependent dehydrogenase
MKHPLPIEIVGGGLAGLSLGLALRRAGVPVTLFESGTYPRHRVCGEFIAGLDASTIGTLGLAPFLFDALRHREVAWFIHEKFSREQTLPTPALAISRHVLDARLAAAFVSAGGNLRTGNRIEGAAQSPGRVFATGRRRVRSPWLGLKIHALDVPLMRDLELHLGSDTYVGLARVDDRRVNVCGLFRRRPLQAQGTALLQAYLQAAGLSHLAARLAASPTDADSFSAVAAVGFDHRVPVASGRFSLGDACAMIPPFTGNGMAMAFQSAAIALPILLKYTHGEITWADATHHVQTALRRHFRLRLASAAVLHPFLLQPPRQRWLAALNRTRLLPLRPLYSALH